ncbi:hypothetical protein B0H14DRAFT_3428178 [Mycena olivaceomarginata]|nr:hypothetical protein B0H14DRAFT_3428178 [Mycena olivaceomarginata]
MVYNPMRFRKSACDGSGTSPSLAALETTSTPPSRPRISSRNTIRNSKRKADENKADDGVDTDSSIKIIPKDKPPKKRKRSTPADAVVDVDDDSVEMSFMSTWKYRRLLVFNIRKNSAKPE